MQTFKSTIKLTPQFHCEVREAHKQFWVSILAIAFVFALVLLFTVGAIPSRSSPEYAELQGWLG